MKLFNFSKPNSETVAALKYMMTMADLKNEMIPVVFQGEDHEQDNYYYGLMIGKIK